MMKDVPECVCPAGSQEPGLAGITFCNQWQCEMTPGWREKCRESVEFRQLWQSGKGPGQQIGLRCDHRSTPSECLFCAATRVVTPTAFRGETEIKISGRPFKMTETAETCVWPASLMVASRILAGRPTGTLVDIGCGAGVIGLAGLSVGCKVTFVDRDPEACQLAEANAQANGFEGFEVVNGDWQTLELATFDNIYGSEVLWENPGDLLLWIDKHWTGNGICCLSHSGSRCDSKLFAAYGFDLAETRADTTYRDHACASAIYLLTRSKVRPESMPPASSPAAVAPVAITVRPTADEWPCSLRGAVLRQEGCGCGANNPKVDVYACSALGECTIFSSGKNLQKTAGGKMAVCVGCENRAG